MNYIKTNNKCARQRGTTLIELSVVIAVILLLVGVLFIGVQAWRDGANRAACLVNLSTIQKAARGYANMNQLDNGVALTFATLDAANFWGTRPSCPTNGAAYTTAGVVPATGVAYAVCPNGHAPANFNNW